MGLTSDSSVLYFDGFESYNSASDLWGNYDNFFQQQNFSIVSEPANVFSGQSSLRITQPNINYAQYNALTQEIAPQVTIFIRFYTKLEDGFSFGYGGAVHNGVDISGNYPGPGQTPDGTDFFYVGLENTAYLGEQQPGYTHGYVYHPDQRSSYGDHWYPDGTVLPGTATPGNFGSDFVARPQHLPETGEWYSVELMVDLNTPGSRDGRIAAWIDGELIADWGDVQFRDTDDLKIDRVQLNLGAASNTDGADSQWFDNLVIATEYIGPMADGSGEPVTPQLMLSVDPDSIAENGGVATGTVTRSGSTAGSLQVALSSDDTGEATVPANVTIGSGASSATFTVRGVDDTIVDGTQEVTLGATASGATGATTTIDVTDNDVAADNNDNGWTDVSTLFRDNVAPTAETNDPTDYELGVRFQASQDGQVTGLRYYRGSADANDTDTRTVNLWSADADKLGAVTIRSTAGESGWRSAELSEPVALQAGETYVASYGTVQNYAYSEGYFGTAHDGPDGVLTAPGGANGVFANGQPGAFPTQTYRSSNYWVDVGFEPMPSNDVPETPSLSLDVAPDTIAENGGVATGTVTRSGSTSGSLPVALSSDDTGEATVPANVTIEDGECSVTFTVRGVDDTTVDGTQEVTLGATASGATAATTTIDVTDNDAPEPPTLSLDGTPGPDSIFGTSGPDLIQALGGPDFIDAEGGDDVVLGGPGRDEILGRAGKDILFGGGDNDTIKGNGSLDILVGGPGDDRLVGGGGLDTAVFAGEFADHQINGSGTKRTVEDQADDGGRDTLRSVELLQFDDGVLDTRDGSFDESGFATPAVETLVTGPSFSTDPEPLLTPVG